MVWNAEKPEMGIGVPSILGDRQTYFGSEITIGPACRKMIIRNDNINVFFCLLLISSECSSSGQFGLSAEGRSEPCAVLRPVLLGVKF